MRRSSFRPIVATSNGLRDVLRIDAELVLSVYVQWKDLKHVPGLLQHVNAASLNESARISGTPASPTAPSRTHRGEKKHDEGRHSQAGDGSEKGRQQASDAPTGHSWAKSFETARERVVQLIRAEAQVSASSASDGGDHDAITVRPDDSLAIFATEHDVHVMPLPYPVKLDVSVDSTPCLAPVLRFYSADYAVGLALHDGGATLFRTFTTESETNAHTSRETRLHVDEDPPMLTARTISLAGMQPVIRWLRAIDVELERYLPRRNHPVVLFGDPALCNAFAALNLHRSLIRTRSDTGTPGVDMMASDPERIRIVSANHVQERADRDLCLFHQTQAAASHRTSINSRVIAAEAPSRRIATLFVDEALLYWPATRNQRTPAFTVPNASGDGATGVAPTLRLPRRTEAISRIERTVAETLVAGGTVHAVRSTRLPVGHHVAAIFRY